MVMSRAVGLDPAVIEEIANRVSDAIVTRVVEALRDEAESARARHPTHWLDAQEVARRLGVSREWVYEHAEELGASRIGKGPRTEAAVPAERCRSSPCQAVLR